MLCAYYLWMDKGKEGEREVIQEGLTASLTPLSDSSVSCLSVWVVSFASDFLLLSLRPTAKSRKRFLRFLRIYALLFHRFRTQPVTDVWVELLEGRFQIFAVG